jgi:hypothetical protein
LLGSALLTNYSQPPTGNKKFQSFTIMSAKSQTRVTFAKDITIIEFPMEIGDNPSVNSGAPVQIGWVPQATMRRNLDMYEHFREGNRRHVRKLILNVPQRLNILLRAGYPLEDIVAAALAADLIQKSRAENNVKKQGWERFSKVLEKTGYRIIPKGLVNGVVGATNGIIKTTGEILISTSKSVKNIVVVAGTPMARQRTSSMAKQRSVPAKSA